MLLRVRYPKKDWAIFLGISEPALSQWTTGKTFPDPGKLRALILAYEKYDLTNIEKEKLDNFMSILEYPLSEICRKGSSNSKNKKASDYILSEIQEDMENSISFLFYQLKSELYNQFLRQIELFQEDLKNKLLNNLQNNDETFYDKVVAMKELQGAFQSKTNITKLSCYVNKVKEIHLDYNRNFKRILNDISLNDDNAPEKGQHGVTHLSLKHDKAKREREFVERVDRVEPNNLGYLRDDHLPWDSFNNSIPNDYLKILFRLKEVFAINHKSRNSYEIIFNNPNSNNEQLLNIKVNTNLGTPKVMSLCKQIGCIGLKEGGSFWDLPINPRAAIKASKVNLGADSNKNFGKILLDSKPLLKKSTNERRDYLIRPEQTKQHYCVEILSVINKEPLINSYKEGILIFIDGEIDIQKTNSRGKFHSCDLPFSDISGFSSLIGYQCENSVALLVQECR